MRYFTTFIFLCFIQTGFAQSVNQYFEKIRDNEVQLTAFFAQMPKGGDLHHHYSGSIYAEPLLEHAIAENFFLNIETMKVAKEKSSNGKWMQFSEIIANGELNAYKTKIMQKWSVKDYNNVDYPSSKLFFESFNKFSQAIDESFESGLLEIKNRAIKENVTYIETQLSNIPCKIDTDNLAIYNNRLREFAKSKNENAVFEILNIIYKDMIQKKAAIYSGDFNINFVQKMHNILKIDDANFTMRYQNYVLRFMEPVDLFKNMLVAFISANTSELIDGVNIVSPEDGETALKDYWLHMVMYKYFHSRYPKVKYALHAGELTLGSVLPEELTWHINTAVYIANANRIGHGVDIAYEDNSYELLRYMAKNKIAVEINLVSNEFILKVKENRHPITLYKEFGVPVVIGTDDAGILRTNMTEQYVLLAKRYKLISYSDIKEFVYNSINYSFIEDDAVKSKLLKQLDAKFKEFESKFL
jgi:adenosine deaminase